MRWAVAVATLAVPACLSEPARPVCDQPSFSDDKLGLADGSPCRPWGTGFGTTNGLYAEDGELTIDLLPNDHSDGGCRGDVDTPFEPGGIFIEVTQAAMFVTGFQKVGMSDGDPIMGLEDGPVLSDGKTKVPFDPVAMRWWRLRPDRANGTVISEYAPDGYAWTQLGVLDVRPPSTFHMRIEASSERGGTARFRHLNVCPVEP